MRTPQIILEDGAYASHCVSRVVGQEKRLTNAFKENVQDIIIDAAHLHGIHLINWIVMSNHIHVLALIPDRDLRQPLTRNSLLSAVKTFYSMSYLIGLKQEFERAAKLEDAKPGLERCLDFPDREPGTNVTRLNERSGGSPHPTTG